MTIIPQYTKSLKVYFNTCDETTCDSAYHMEYLDMDLECDTCGFMGSYYLDGEKYKIGQCSICLMKSGVVDKIIIDWMVYITNFANKDMNTKQTDLERAKSQIFSDIAGCLNSTNNEYWITVIVD